MTSFPVCPGASRSLSIDNVRSLLQPASLLTDGDQILHFADLTPDHPERLGRLLAHYSDYFSASESLNANSLTDSEKRRAQLAQTLWKNFRKLQRLLSITQSPIAFSKLSFPQATTAIQQVFSALECHGIKLSALTRKSWQTSLNVYAGDSLVTPFSAVFWQQMGVAENQIGVSDYESRWGNLQFPADYRDMMRGNAKAFYRKLTWNYLSQGGRLTQSRPYALSQVEGFPGQTLESFLLPLAADPFLEGDRRPEASFGIKFYERPWRDTYRKNLSHLDAMSERIQERAQNHPGSFVVINVGLGGNNFLNSLFHVKPLDFNQVAKNLDTLSAKAQTIRNSHPGSNFIFRLPPNVLLLLKQVEASDELYDEQGQRIPVGHYSYLPFFNAKQKIPSSLIVSPEDYERIESEQSQFRNRVREVLEPQGWIVQEEDSSDLQSLLAMPLELELEGFGKITRQGFQDLFRIDGAHPTGLLEAVFRIREAYELRQLGFGEPIPETISSLEWTRRQLVQTIQKNPSPWFQNQRMPDEKIANFLKRLAEYQAQLSSLPLSEIAQKQILEAILFEFWSYFEREELVELLKILNPDLKRLKKVDFEKRLATLYRQVLQQEAYQGLTIAETLKPHQIAHIIRFQLAQKSPSQFQTIRLSLVEKLTDYAQQRKMVAPQLAEFSRAFFQSASQKPTRSLPVSTRLEQFVSIQGNTSPQANWTTRAAFEAYVPSTRRGIWQFQPFNGGIFSDVVFQSGPAYFDWRVGLQIKSCLAWIPGKIGLCGGVEFSHSLLTTEPLIETNGLLTSLRFYRFAPFFGHGTQLFIEPGLLPLTQDVYFRTGAAWAW